MATSYINPGVTVSVINTPVINSTANNPVNICIVGDIPVASTTTDTITFKYSSSYNSLSSSFVAQDSVTKRPLIQSAKNLYTNASYTLGTDYQASWVNGTTVIAGMPCIKVNGSPATGAYTLTFAINGNTNSTVVASGIAYNATPSAVATAVQTAARASSAFNDATVAVSGAVGTNGEIILTVVPTSGNATQSILTFYSSTNTFTGGTSPSVSSYATSNGLKTQTLVFNYTVDSNSAYGNTLSQFNSASGVNNQFGPAIVTDSSGNSSVNSPVTLAAQLAFQNGASQVWVFPVKRAVPTAASTSTDWSNAFTAMEIVNGIGVIDTIVPLYDYTTSGFDRTTFANYLSYQQLHSILQRMFVSQDTSASTAQATSLAADAAIFGNQRISLVAPTIIQYQVSSNSQIDIGGFYVAAALAGLLSSLPGPQEPLTHKVLQGFVTINPPISTADYITLQTYGVLCVKQKADGTIYVRHGLTTNTTNWLTEEISIIAAQDALYNNIRNTIDNSTVIGSALTQNTAHAVVSIIQGVLTDAVNINLIQAYTGLQFTQSTTLPTTITVTFQYSPTFPLNYVNVSFSINPTAGTVSFNTVSNAFNTTTGA